ncbi:unknown [Clostridium sp. CAG:1000]|nr:sporulation inhibitor of replication protein SirA [Clostridium sp.]CCX36146.1 unknown [Clostridium sp. CAG:1000]
MRTFYLFDVKENILKNYRNNYEELYSLLESIHYLKTEDIILGFNIYQRIVNPMKKEEYNDYIKKNNLGKENYICYNYTHTINDFYFNESTKMIINNSHIKIKTNKNVPSFFYNIRNFKNIFVCDFNNHDYFLLEDTIYSSCITS